VVCVTTQVNLVRNRQQSDFCLFWAWRCLPSILFWVFWLSFGINFHWISIPRIRICSVSCSLFIHSCALPAYGRIIFDETNSQHKYIGHRVAVHGWLFRLLPDREEGLFCWG